MNTVWNIAGPYILKMKGGARETALQRTRRLMREEAGEPVIRAQAPAAPRPRTRTLGLPRPEEENAGPPPPRTKKKIGRKGAAGRGK